MEFIEQVRVGSHREWVETDDKGHGFHIIVVDYTSRFHDCLPGKDWLEAHHQDPMPEPTIDILVDGEVIGSIRGIPKRGVIKSLLQPYTTKARVGRKICIFPFGEADRVGEKK